MSSRSKSLNLRLCFPSYLLPSQLISSCFNGSYHSFMSVIYYSYCVFIQTSVFAHFASFITEWLHSQIRNYISYTRTLPSHIFYFSSYTTSVYSVSPISIISIKSFPGARGVNLFLTRTIFIFNYASHLHQSVYNTHALVSLNVSQWWYDQILRFTHFQFPEKKPKRRNVYVYFNVDTTLHVI